MKLLRRKKLLAAVLVVLIVVVGPYLVSRVLSPWRRVRVFSDDVETAVEGGSTIRVVSYNVAHGRGATDDNWEEWGSEKAERIAEIAEFLSETNADVVVLNEVDFCSAWSGHQNQAAAIAKSAGFPYRVEHRSVDFRLIYGSAKFGNAILSRYPIVDAEIVDFPARVAWEDWLAGSKRGVVCTLRISPQQQVRVFAVHLDPYSEAIRAASAEMIVEVAGSSEVPLIAAGDFNSTPSGFPGSCQSPAGKNAMDILASSGKFQMTPEQPPQPKEFTYSSYRPTSVIDWIIIPSGWKFTDYRAIDSSLSDHRPVVATVEME